MAWSQEVMPVAGLPLHIGPGTQGELVYEGPAASCFYWLCDSFNFIPITEAMEDAHLTKGGLLASFDFSYCTFGTQDEPAVQDDLTVIVTFYANNAADSCPPVAEIASYRIDGLPRYRGGCEKRTFDVPQPGPLIPADVWMGVELVFPPGSQTIGSVEFHTNSDLCSDASVDAQTGLSHDIGWFGPSACDVFSFYDFDPVEPPNTVHNPPCSIIWEEFAPGQFTQLNYNVAIRVFDAPPGSIPPSCTSGTPTCGNNPPACTADLAEARESFLEVSPGSFVVTEGETIEVTFTGNDPDDDPLTVSSSALPPGATLSPLSGGPPLASTFSWTPTAADKAGAPYTVTVTFTDTSGASSSCEVAIADVNLKPVCTASDQTAECTSNAGASLTLDGSATDADDDDASLMYHWDVSNAAVVLDDPDSATPTGIFPISATMATLTVTDGRGGVALCDVLITVEDTLPPQVMCTSDLAMLWPPNHTMRPVTLIVTATDACVEPGEVLPITVRVRSDEPDDATGNGDGNTTGDVDGLDGYSLVPGGGVDVTSRLDFDSLNQRWVGTVQLRAERSGTGDGRKYTIDVQALDGHGNTGETSCCVIVPHDRRRVN